MRTEEAVALYQDRDSHHKLDKSAKITHVAGCGEGRQCNQQLAALLLLSAAGPAVVIVMIAAPDGCDDAVLSVALITNVPGSRNHSGRLQTSDHRTLLRTARRVWYFSALQ